MKRLFALAVLAFPSVAHATQTSFWCKSKTTTDIIDVVSKGERTNDVLVQINGGKFFDGTTVLLGKILIVSVSFDKGGLMLSYGPGEASVYYVFDDTKNVLDLVCKFR